jgi:exonuclease III
MTGITINLSILTLKVNRLNYPIKRYHLANWIKKEDPKFCCLQETHLIDRNKHWIRVKDWKKIYQANRPWEQAGVAIFITDKVHIKSTLIKWEKEWHSILIKGEIHQKKITVINLYALNFIKHTLKDLKKYINSNTVVERDFNTLITNRKFIQTKKIMKEILDLNHTINQMDLVDVYRIFHPTSAQYTFFSEAHRTFSKTDHILGHKAPQQI